MRLFPCKLKDYLVLRVLICALVFAVIGPLIFVHHLNKDVGSRDFAVQSFQSRTKLDKTYGKDEFLLERLEEYRRQIKELERIKLSLSNELRDLEGKRHIIQKDIQKLHESAEKLQKESNSVKDLVSRAKRKLDVYKLEKSKLSHCPQLPEMRLPKAPELTLHRKQILSFGEEDINSCNLDKCFDFTRCPYAGGFSFYVYDPTNNLIGSNPSIDALSVYKILKNSSYYTPNATSACVYIVLIGLLGNLLKNKDKTILEDSIHSLPYWNKDGRNHFLLQFNSDQDIRGTRVNFGMAFVGQPSFSTSTLRPGFDLIIPPIFINQSTEKGLWKEAPPQLPAFRKYFLSFEGEITKAGKKYSFLSANDFISLSKEANDFYIFTNCKYNNDKSVNKAGQLEWMLCGSHETRIAILKKSTFTIIPTSVDSMRSWDSTYVRLVEALQSGAIPVILNSVVSLPFSDLIDWRLTAIILPPARITELNALLHTVTVNDLVKLRQQARFIWENYFSTPKATLDAILAAVRTKLSLPGQPLLPTPSASVFSPSNKPLINPPDPDAVLELPIKSPTFTRNFTSTVNFVRNQWNEPPGPLHLLPSSPFEPILPSSASFKNSTTEFEHIGGGKGGSGEAFSRAQGGNYPKEQFTVVILTYERDVVLMESIQRLVGLQYLNKLIVVWNSPLTPSPSLRWPDIGVPVHVIKASKNSLNNRFIPYDVVETDAVLSIDDDVELRHDEILLAFRVWRENRDRIVGFPGRYHAWDDVNKRWTYESKYACELSLILTGAAFIHRYYFYLYTHWMPKPILNKVDEYMNCEDIAMNFLVSHVTRKPPLKVTSRWTFLCPSCPVSLWEDKSHFEERNKCMNYFERVYGYMPLLKTQYRADSVLFKTRIPSTETKCFKYV